MVEDIALVDDVADLLQILFGEISVRCFIFVLLDLEGSKSHFCKIKH